MANASKSSLVSLFAKSKNVGKSLEAMRKAKAATGKSQVPPGQYVGRIVSVLLAANKDNQPQVSFNLVVASGDHKGEPLPRVRRTLADERGGWGTRTEAENFERLSRDLQSCGVDVDEIKSTQNLVDAIEELSGSGRLISVQVNAPTQAGGWPSMYLNSVIESEEPASEDDEDDEEEEGDDDNEEGDSQDAPFDESEEKTIVKKDQVTYTPEGSRRAVTCTVMASNNVKKTCDLQDIATKKAYRGVSWEDVELIKG
jgi:ribosomal protein L12E/L44/L45/RPP1/RPP2